MNHPTIAQRPTEQCCLVDRETGKQCPLKAEFWVGSDGTDDYTHTCAGHIEILKMPGDIVLPLHDEPRISSGFWPHEVYTAFAAFVTSVRRFLGTK